MLHNGVYRGQCTQLCGLYHSLMFFNVRSVSPGTYRTWLRVTGAFQRAHPAPSGSCRARVKANINGTAPGYSGNSGNSGTGRGNTGNTGGAYYGD